MTGTIEEKSLKDLLNCDKKSICFALISDTHIGGKFESFKRYKKGYEIIAKHNILNVFHLGDFFEGGDNPNQNNYNQDLDWKVCENDIERAFLYYPNIPGIKTFIVRGYHDTMTNALLEPVCMIDYLCKYRKDLVNITSQVRFNSRYLNTYSDIYFWDNIRILFRHGDVENISFVPTERDICITITGHYHEFKYSDSSNCITPKLIFGEHRIHVPALGLSSFKEFVDLIILEITEEFLEISPISLEGNGLILSKRKIYRNT